MASHVGGGKRGRGGYAADKPNKDASFYDSFRFCDRHHDLDSSGRLMFKAGGSGASGDKAVQSPRGGGGGLYPWAQTPKKSGKTAPRAKSASAKLVSNGATNSHNKKGILDIDVDGDTLQTNAPRTRQPGADQTREALATQASADAVAGSTTYSNAEDRAESPVNNSEALTADEKKKLANVLGLFDNSTASPFKSPKSLKIMKSDASFTSQTHAQHNWGKLRGCMRTVVDLLPRSRRMDLTTGAQQLKEFKAHVTIRCQNLVRAWRLVLDPLDNKVVTYSEFSRNVRNFGFTGSIPALWHYLDRQDAGHITLHHLCPIEADKLDSFRAMLQGMFGTAEAAWKSIATRGQANMTFNEFREACRQLGWTHDLENMPKWLTGDCHGSNLVTKSDLIWLGLTPEPMHLTGAERRVQLLQQKEAQQNQELGPSNLAGFKTFLKCKYGNFVRAWRLCLDSNGDGVLTFEEFAKSSRGAGYTGSVSGLWKSLLKEGHEDVHLEDLDVKTAEELNAFKEFLLEKGFKYAEEAWSNGLATRGQQFLGLPEFETSCRVLGYTRNSERMHLLLRSDPWGGKTINVSDILWLGLPSSAKVEEGHEKRLRLAAEAESAKSKDMAANDMEGFRVFLKHRFGNLVRAWRVAMYNGNNMYGALTKHEFSKSMRNLGFNGPISSLWKEMEDEKTGVITLQEFAPQQLKILEKFRDFLLERYESAQCVWQKGLAVRGQAQLRVDDWVNALENIGFQGNGRYIHSSLCADKHIDIVTVFDIEYLGIKPLPTDLTAYQQARLKEAANFEDGIKYSAITAPQQLKEKLVKDYGNMARAWRCGLDPRDKIKIDIDDLAKAAEDLYYSGNINSLWKNFAGESSVLTLKTLSPHIAEELMEFRRLLNSNYGKPTEAWEKIIEEKSNDHDAESIFSAVCIEVGWKRDAGRLAKLLIYEEESETVTVADIAWLMKLGRLIEED